LDTTGFTGREAPEHIAKLYLRRRVPLLVSVGRFSRALRAGRVHACCEVV